MVNALNLVLGWILRLAGLVLIAAWFAAPAQAGSGTVGDPYTSLSEAYTVPSSGRYFFNLGSGTFAVDVDTSEGGGWVLVLQYVHGAGFNSLLSIRGAGANLPVTSIAALGANESGIPDRWGHAGNAAMSQFAGDIETRWFGRTSGHSRIIHFRTRIGNDYFRTGVGNMEGLASNFTPLTGHNGFTPGTATEFYDNKGDYAFTNIPFYQPAARHWSVRGQGTDNVGGSGANGNRWEVDEFTSNASRSTIHRVWVRAAQPSVVTNTLDRGSGSLRDAIAFANSNPGADAITFNIPGAGPHTITLASSLPDITDAGLSIDGITQPGSACGQLSTGTPHTLQIFVNGNNAAANAFYVFAANTTLRGMAVGNFIEKGFWVLSTSGALIECNYWGVRPDGVTPAPLVTGGLTGPVQFQSATNSVFRNNLVSGNNAQTDDVGLIVSDASNGIVISGNNFGLNATASAALGNAATGLRVSDSDTVTIGGMTAADRNIFGGNGADGVWILRSFLVDVIGNYVGLSANGATALGNAGTGILIENSDTLTLGNGTAAGRNVIAGNAGRGIRVIGDGSNIVINGNYVGTSATGNTAIANGFSLGGGQRDAISFDGFGTTNNVTVTNNIIGGSANAQLEFFGVTINGLTIRGNSIGVGADGSTAIAGGNTEPMVFLGGPGNFSNVSIGGSGPGEGNVIANGGAAGILMEAAGTNTTIIGNTIRNNAANGVAIRGSGRASILANSIFDNGILGIDLSDNGVTANDPGDGDAGPNDLLNFPQIISANVIGSTQVQYNVTLNVPASADGYRIEFFASTAADPSGFGEGERYLGHVDVNHEGGTQTYTGTLTTLEPVSIGDVIASTATRRTAGGSWDITSEFSAVATAGGVAVLTVEIASEVFDPPVDNPFRTPGQDILLTATVNNNGTDSTDSDSIFVAIAIDPASTFFNDVTAALGGVIGFQSAAPALSFTPGTDLLFSDSAAPPGSLADCNYTPAVGYDSQVRHVCINPKGTLPAGQFEVRLRTRIN